MGEGLIGDRRTEVFVGPGRGIDGQPAVAARRQSSEESRVAPSHCSPCLRGVVTQELHRSLPPKLGRACQQRLRTASSPTALASDQPRARGVFVGCDKSVHLRRVVARHHGSLQRAYRTACATPSVSADNKCASSARRTALTVASDARHWRPGGATALRHGMRVRFAANAAVAALRSLCPFDVGVGVNRALGTSGASLHPIW